MSNASGVEAVAVGVPGGHEHDRAGGERDAAILDLGGHDPRGERRDRLVAERLVDRRQRQPARVGAQRLPLIGVLGEQPDRVRELALAGVDAADEDVQDQVAQLVVARAGRPPPRPRSARRSGRRPALRAGRRSARPRRRRTRPPPARSARARSSGWLHRTGAGSSWTSGVGAARRQRRAHHLGDHQRRVGLGERAR